MRLTIRCFCYILLLLTISTKISKSLRTKFAIQNLRVRVRRQDGYVYDKPNISFDLPSQFTTESTQATTVDRTLTQHMFYGYPAPASGDSFVTNSASPASATTSVPSPSAGAADGYNYRSSAYDNTSSGYNYQASGFTVQGNADTSVTNTASQASVNNPQPNSSRDQVIAGYNNNVPSPALLPSLQGPLGASTSAPRYLPPAVGGGNRISGVIDSANVGSITNPGTVPGSISTSSANYLPPLSNNAVLPLTTGDGRGNSGGTGSANNNGISRVTTSSLSVPPVNYLPPLGNNDISIGQTLKTNNQANISGSVSVPSTSYLPPISSPSVATSSPAPAPSSTQSPTPIGSYIPPSNTVLNSGAVVTPAPKYLPPVFF